MVQRANPGAVWNPPRAQDWNDIGEATEAYMRTRAGNAAPKKRLLVATDWMLCRNDTGDRRAGDVLEAGEYLFAVVDPLCPWFEGQAPTDPVSKSTHGVLRVASADTQIERVQVSGLVRAYVNVTDTSDEFCDAEAGLYVLQSNNNGPHKIVWKPVGTGEKTCFVLLYAAVSGEELLAKAELSEDLCPVDAGGTGTGSIGQVVSVENARYYPTCRAFEPTRVVNPRNHRGPLGSTITMIRMACSGVDEEWEIIDIELQNACTVVGMEDRPSCFVYASLRMAAEWCPDDEPTEACIAVEYEPCPLDPALDPCDTSWTFDPLFACCWLP